MKTEKKIQEETDTTAKQKISNDGIYGTEIACHHFIFFIQVIEVNQWEDKFRNEKLDWIKPFPMMVALLPK